MNIDIERNTIGKLLLGGQLTVRKLPPENIIVDRKYQLLNRLRLDFWKGWLQVKIAKLVNKTFGIAVITSELRGRLIKADGTIYDLGLLSNRVVTTAFVNFLAAQLQTDSTVIGDFKYHDSGVGTTDPAVGDTDMETTDGESRVTGTQVASTNTYTSVGTITYTTSKSITEHGLFSAASGATLMDRSEFAAKAVVNTDRIEYTYVLTITAGG